MGTPKYATSVLKGLVDAKFNVVASFTQPDRLVGRKKVLTPPDVKKYIIQNSLNIEIYQPTTLKDEKIYNIIVNLKPDFIIVAAYGQILPKNILDICPCINLHASILPKYRGASPIQSAVLDGEKFSGVTAMNMGIGLDNGDMLGFSYIDIKDLKSDEIFEKMSSAASNLTIKILQNFNFIKPLSQIQALSTKCSKIKKDDGLIKFSDDVNLVMRKFRAYHPWPGIFLEDGTKFLDIKIASNSNKFDVGVISNLEKDSFNLQFFGGEIKVLKLQEVGKKPLLAKDFINGKRLNVGDRICK